MPQGATGFEQMYPNIARWVQSYGWIEIGDDGQSPSFIIGHRRQYILISTYCRLS